ncbi:imidazolonepropionase-like amidohydrolase [Novosphingobium sp. SG751A]|uniref:amidohydrolase family protein n=1 Tax=Novosphingobium sp. SG751A TaxID=2587000 RepID=UPI001557B771|nr:amidohydrolase family protein [Novosphingobium sp. SG751A]NOW45852.1 imidazolonepropionase-like amidohydrolase [Novosphingobium sp. SG751A]
MPKLFPILLCGAALIPAQAMAATPAIAFIDATVFDGTGAAPVRESVLVQNGRIVAVGAKLKLPAGTRKVAAQGKALLPGFFDVHTHWTPGGSPETTPQIATAYVQSGITTVNDFHQQPESYAPRRAWLAQLVAPHVNFAARISTPGGHGADWADQATTIWINTPEAARAAIKSLEAYKPDLIKAFTDGWRYGAAPDNTSMDRWTLKALSDEAHKRGWSVLTHTVTVERGVAASMAGVDSLGHVIQDRPATPDEVAQIAKSGMGMAPTLAVYDPDKPGQPKADETRQRKFSYALKNVKALFDAGVPISVGTDAGMPGTPHGLSTLHELELLVRAGLTPAQALVAATQTSAKVMRLDGDRGTIAPGKRADILLIDGKPWENIGDIHKIAQVYIDGRLVSGAGAPPLPAANLAKALPSVKIAALVDDFERKDRRSSLDTLRLETGDGGMDRTVEITQTVPREGGGQALLLSAKMAMKGDAYAGFAVPLTRGSVVPVNLAGYKGIRFDIRGEGAYVLRLNGLDGVWSAPVSGGAQWASVEVPFTALVAAAQRGKTGPAFTGDGIVQLELGGSREGGQRLWVEVDNITFY